jgi:hypothetical protein
VYSFGRVAYPATAAYENITTHEGDLIIAGTQTFLIENCTYVQTGGIYVRDWTKLIARNAEIKMNQSYIHQYEFQVENYATLDLENSSLKSNYALNLRLDDYSKATLSNLVISLGSTSSVGFFGFSSVDVNLLAFAGIFGIHVQGQPNVSIRNSQIEQFAVWFSETQMPTVKLENSVITLFGLSPWPDQTVQIDRLEPGRFEFLDLGEKVNLEKGGVSEPLRITLNQTYIGAWDARVVVSNESKTIISESTLTALVLEYVEGFVYIENVGPQFFEWREIGQVTLNRTRVEVAVNVSPSGNSKVTVVNSYIALYPRDNSIVCLINSVVEWSGFYDFLGSLCLNHTLWRGWEVVFFSNFYVYGIGSFETFPPQWFSSRIRRNYGVILTDAEGEPVPNATVTLESKDGNLTWNGITDDMGRANFNITFADNNHTDTHVLRTFKEDFYNATIGISFLSSAPITINLTQKPLGDINEDHSVDILDVFIVARSFGAKPEDPNWNGSADLDKNSVIDILDVFAVARDYGKTV